MEGIDILTVSVFDTENSVPMGQSPRRILRSAIKRARCEHRLHSRLSEIRFATFDYTRKWLPNSALFAQPGDPNYDPNVERQVKSIFKRRDPLSAEARARAARERGAPVIATALGSHTATEGGKKVLKPGQKVRPYNAIKSEITRQQKDLTAYPVETPQEELPPPESLPRQKGGKTPVRGSGVPGATAPPPTWDPAKGGPGEIHHTYPGQLPPHLRPSPTSEEVRTNALKWREPVSYHEAKVRAGIIQNSIKKRSTEDISGLARSSTGLPGRFLPEGIDTAERVEIQQARDKLAHQIRSVRNDTLIPLRQARRKVLGLPGVKPMTPRSMASLRLKAYRRGDKEIKATNIPFIPKHTRDFVDIHGAQFAPYQISSIHQGQQDVVAEHQAQHVARATAIKEGIGKKISERLSKMEEEAKLGQMGDARRATITRHDELRKSAKSILDAAFDPERTSIEGDLARVPAGPKGHLTGKDLDDFEVNQVAEHAGVTPDYLRRQHKRFVHHTRMGTQQSGADAIKRSLGTGIFDKIQSPPPASSAPHSYPRMKLLGKRLGIGAGITAGVGLAAYGIHKWRNRNKEFSARLREIRLSEPVKIPLSQAKRLMVYGKARFIKQLRAQGRLKGYGVIPKQETHPEVVRALVKSAERYEGLMSHLHQNLIKNSDVVTGARFKVSKKQLDQASTDGYLRGTSDMEGIVNNYKRATGDLRDKLSSSRRVAIGAGAAGLGVGAGAGYLVARNRNREKQFSIPGSNAIKHLQGKLKGLRIGKVGKHELIVGSALTGGITAADAVTSAVYPEPDKTRKQAAWSGAKRGAIYGAVLSGVEPLIRMPLDKRLHLHSSKMKTIQLESGDPPSPWNPKKRLTVVQDRYRKTIREREIERKEANIGKSAVSGAVVGALLRHKLRMGTVPALAVGAAGGVAAQVGTLLHGRTTRDPYGEESISAKRIERVPYQAGTVAAAGIAGHQLYKGARRLKLFSSNGRIISFQFVPTENKNDPWLEKQAKRWIEHPQSRVEDAQKWIGRAKRINRDRKLERTDKGTIVDERGRERTPEWRRPWFKKTLYGGAAVAGLVGLGMLKHRIGKVSDRGAKLLSEGVHTNELLPTERMALNITSSNAWKAAGMTVTSRFPSITSGTRKVSALRQEGKDMYNRLLQKGNEKIEARTGQITGAVAKRHKKTHEIYGYDLINPQKAQENLDKLNAAEAKTRKIVEERIPAARKRVRRAQVARSVMDDLTDAKKLSALLDRLIEFKESEYEDYVQVKPHYRKQRRGKALEETEGFKQQQQKTERGALYGSLIAAGGIGASSGIVWKTLRDRSALHEEDLVSERLAAIKAARRAATRAAVKPATGPVATNVVKFVKHLPK